MTPPSPQQVFPVTNCSERQDGGIQRPLGLAAKSETSPGPAKVPHHYNNSGAN